MAASTRSIHCDAAMHDITNDAPTAAMPISAPCFGMRLPKKMMRTNAIAGTVGMSQAASSIAVSPSARRSCRDRGSSGCGR